MLRTPRPAIRRSGSGLAANRTKRITPRDPILPRSVPSTTSTSPLLKTLTRLRHFSRFHLSYRFQPLKLMFPACDVTWFESRIRASQPGNAFRNRPRTRLNLLLPEAQSSLLHTILTASIFSSLPGLPHRYDQIWCSCTASRPLPTISPPHK